MSNTRALLLLPLAATMLALAALDEPIVEALRAAGLESDAVAGAAPVVATALAAGGFVVLVLLLVGVVTNANRAARAQPYEVALKAFAAEFGRGVLHTPDGLSIDLLRDGQRVEVQVDTRARTVVVRSPPPARQALAWLVQGGAPPMVAAQWREVDHGARWQMRAELPAMARPLLADGALMDVIGGFFARPEARTVSHTLGGMVIEAVLPNPQDAEVLVRLATEIAFRLRRVNG